MTDFPILFTRRLYLREFRTSDIPAIFDIFSRPEVTRFHNVDTMTEIAQAEKIVNARMSIFEKESGIRWAVTLHEDRDMVIGSCGVYQCNKAFFSCEIGYDLHPAYWNKGMTTEALMEIIPYCYSDKFFFPLNRIQAMTFQQNIPSIRVLEKMGFKKEGVQRECAYWKGSFHDLLLLSLLRREWNP